MPDNDDNNDNPSTSSPSQDASTDSTAAFNPDTGEINWSCPCLGGMADGPCGESFKAAFSCFVYSTAEPKGLDCVEQFREMQECFRKYPDVYADELRDEEDEEGIHEDVDGEEDDENYEEEDDEEEEEEKEEDEDEEDEEEDDEEVEDEEVKHRQRRR